MTLMAFIIIPIKYGYIEKGKFIGWLAISCSYCRTVQPAGCYDVNRQNTLYDIKVSRSRAVSKRLICSFCNEEVNLQPNTPIKLDANWNPSQGIQQLINSTNPALGIVVKARNRSANEIKAILRRIEEWTDYAFHNESKVVFLFGIVAIISFIIGSLLGGYFPQIDGIENYTIVYGVSFAVVGCIVSYFVAKYYFVRQNLLIRLSQAGVDKGISRDEFVKTLAIMPHKKKELVWAVNSLFNS